MAKTAHRHCPEWPCNLKHMCAIASRVVGFDRSWYGVVAPITQVGVGGSHRSGWQVTGWWGGVWGRFSGCGILRVWVFPLQNLIYIPGQDAWVTGRTSRSTRPHTPLRTACLARAP